jgi:hypothetical protein
MEEATETSAQTTKEAQHGDHQAKLLLQKQAAAAALRANTTARESASTARTEATPPTTATEAISSPTVNDNGQTTGTLVNTTA